MHKLVGFVMDEVELNLEDVLKRLEETENEMNNFMKSIRGYVDGVLENVQEHWDKLEGITEESPSSVDLKVKRSEENNVVSKRNVKESKCNVDKQEDMNGSKCEVSNVEISLNDIVMKSEVSESKSSSEDAPSVNVSLEFPAISQALQIWKKRKEEKPLRKSNVFTENTQTSSPARALRKRYFRLTGAASTIEHFFIKFVFPVVKKKKSSAAVNIQRVWRGHCDRKWFRMHIGDLYRFRGAAVHHDRSIVRKVLTIWRKFVTWKREWRTAVHLWYKSEGPHLHQHLGREFDGREIFSREGHHVMSKEFWKWRMKSVSFVKWMFFTVGLHNLNEDESSSECEEES